MLTSHRAIRVLALMVAMSAGRAGLSAVPATRPAPEDKNTTEYVSPLVSVKFRVPKLWTRRDTTGAHADAMFLFDPAPKKKASTITFQQLVEIYLDKPTATQKSLEDVVHDVKEALVKRTPKLKFTKDAAVKFAGRSAWTLHWTESIALQTQNPDGSKSSAGSMDFDRVSFVFLEHDTLVQIGLHADTRLMPTLIQKAEPVAKSITWDETPAK